MNHDDMVEAIVRIDEGVSALCKQFDKVSNGTGFPRCVDRESRITVLEKWKDRMEKYTFWGITFCSMGIITWVGSKIVALAFGG